MQNTTNEVAESLARLERMGPHAVDAERALVKTIELDRVEREKLRQVERAAFVDKEGRDRFDEWIESMRAKFRREAGEDFDRVKPELSFEAVARLRVPTYLPEHHRTNAAEVDRRVAMLRAVLDGGAK